MDGKDVVKSYLNAMFGGTNNFDEARTFLEDDLKYIGPILKAKNADDFIMQMKAIGQQAGMMKADIINVIQEGPLVAALYKFEKPAPTYFSEWFEVTGDGKIRSITIVHDTKQFS